MQAICCLPLSDSGKEKQNNQKWLSTLDWESNFSLFSFTGDEMFSDIYKIKESENGMMIEVEGKVCQFILINFLKLSGSPPMDVRWWQLRTPLKVMTYETTIFWVRSLMGYSKTNKNCASQIWVRLHFLISFADISIGCTIPDQYVCDVISATVIDSCFCRWSAGQRET